MAAMSSTDHIREAKHALKLYAEDANRGVGGSVERSARLNRLLAESQAHSLVAIATELERARLSRPPG